MMEWFHQVDWFAVLCWLGAISCIVAGLAGTVIPAIPGLPLIAASRRACWCGHVDWDGRWHSSQDRDRLYDDRDFDLGLSRLNQIFEAKKSAFS